MVSVNEATSIIQQNLFTPQAEKLLLSKANGRILAETIVADRDLPAVNRATMDGIAIAYESFAKGQRSYSLEGLLAAGTPATPLTSTRNSIEIMTGAGLPPNADTVIRYEDVQIQNSIATILVDSIEIGQSIHRYGQDAQQNEVLLTPGIRLSPAEIALIASVGKSEVSVFAFPVVAIVSTGNELVSIEETPLPHQVRRSNSYALQAALQTVGCSANLFHLADDELILEKELKKIFSTHHVIILSGGVSKGKFDFVPGVLNSLGIQKKFHQVSQRPGKPLWFGTSAQRTVFALPGNPVSTYLCFYRYILPWLNQSLQCRTNLSYAILAKDFSFKPTLTYFLQVKTLNESGKIMAYPDAGGGSGDFVNLKEVDGFLELPADRELFKAGEAFPYYSFRS